MTRCREIGHGKNVIPMSWSRSVASSPILADLFDLKQKFDEEQRQSLLLERLQEREQWEQLLHLYFTLKIPVIELAVLSKVPSRDDWRTKKPLSFDKALSWILK